jgi:hypothetical protein
MTLCLNISSETSPSRLMRSQRGFVPETRKPSDEKSSFGTGISERRLECPPIAFHIRLPWVFASEVISKCAIEQDMFQLRPGESLQAAKAETALAA